VHVVQHVLAGTHDPLYYALIGEIVEVLLLGLVD
jgi:hypothetical protein